MITFIRICGRDFNMKYIKLIEVCAAIDSNHAVITVEYDDKSITFPIKGDVERNRMYLTKAYDYLYRNPNATYVDTGIEAR